MIALRIQAFINRLTRRLRRRRAKIRKGSFHA